MRRNRWLPYSWPLFISGLLVVLFGGYVIGEVDNYFGLLTMGCGVVLIMAS